MNKGRTIGLVIAVDIGAVVCLISLWGYHGNVEWIGLFLLATLVGLAGANPIRIPALKSSISATDPFVFTALAAYGPLAACVVAVAGVLGSTFTKGAGRQPLHLAFNMGNVAFSVGLASPAYILSGGEPGGAISAQILPLVVATTVYFLLNTGLVTTAIVLSTGRTFISTWSQSGLWTAVSAYAGLTLSSGLLLALKLVGPPGLALGIPPCWLLAAFYRSHKERQEEQQKRIAQVEELNLELEDKVTERTGELQHALSHIERANKHLRVGNERLMEANRAKSEFLANVSHELRTPLNAIIGFSELLEDSTIGPLNEQQSEFIHDIHESGEHLLRLINAILDLSKIEAGKMEVHKEDIELPQIIREAAAMLHPLAAKSEVRLRVDFDDSVRMGRLDPGMVRQVLVNLLSNAVKFTPADGEVCVIASRRNDDLIVHVDDTGIGIEPADLEKIFDEFYQVDGSYARKHAGTGLGLALVRRMVEMQDGKISATSKPGAGSRFTITFRGCLLEDAPQPVEEVEEEVEGTVCCAQGREILVVEDNPVNMKLASNVLKARGYRVYEATSGEEALRMIHEHRTDLVLMDIQLPDMDGLEVTRRLKADPATADLPVVALTAHAMEADERKARDAGCVGYITKPIRLAQFPAQVEAYLPVSEHVI